MYSNRRITTAIGIFSLLVILTSNSPEVQALDELMKEKITNKIRLVEGTDQFERWKELPFPLKFKIYAFNIQNPDDILLGAKPIVEEVGPFVYNIYPRKENVRYDKATDRLTYEQYLSFEFDEENSAVDENTEITVLNMPFQDVFLALEKMDVTTSLNSVWNRIFHGDGMFITIPARSFFFDGYQFCKAEELTGVANTVPRIVCNTIKSIMVESKISTPDSEKIQFSLFSYKVDSSDGQYQISAGNENIETLGEILSWDGLEYLNTWNDESSTCNRIRGTDSTIYRPFNDESSTFDIFISDTCRILNLKTTDSTTYNGVEGIVAKIDANEMSNTGDKSCYCIAEVKNLDGEFDCLPDGFADMNNCLNSHTVTSLPHMLWADETYRSTVTGLEPDEDKHASFAIIEPNSGTPLQVALRTQYNMIVRPIANIEYTENITPAVIPIAWVEQEYVLSEELTNELEDLLADLADTTSSPQCVCRKY